MSPSRRQIRIGEFRSSGCSGRRRRRPEISAMLPESRGWRRLRIWSQPRWWGNRPKATGKCTVIKKQMMILAKRCFAFWKEEMTYPEIIGVHIENLTVELAQFRVGRLDVVQVLHCQVQRLQHYYPMSRDWRVSVDGSDTVQISKFAEIALSPGVDYQHSVPNKKRRILNLALIL